LIQYECAADYPPSESAGGDTPLSEGSTNASGEGTFPPPDGRTAWNAQLPANARSCRLSELRVKGKDGNFRAFYYAASLRGVLVFHAFVKKTQRTAPLEIELARKRLKELLDA